jgi:(2Fe-2S) ferredoxin
MTGLLSPVFQFIRTEGGIYLSTWNLTDTQHHVLICNGGSCMRQWGEEVTQAIRDEIKANGADASVHTTRTRCNGRCEDACVVVVYPEGTWYREVTPELGRKIVKQHLLEGQPLSEQAIYTYDDGFVWTGAASLGTTKK